VASERQIAANRRNARNSTGPQSRGGKKRAGRNAYRHGLTVSITASAALTKQLEKLARKIAGNTENEFILERARAVAHAEVDLARVRRAKIAMIERVRAFGDLDPPQQAFRSVSQIRRFFNALDRGILIVPQPVDPASTMPSLEPERTAEAIRRAIPELLKLDRYEQRASARRDQAVRGLNRR
jgi:hypothetical protein